MKYIILICQIWAVAVLSAMIVGGGAVAVYGLIYHTQAMMHQMILPGVILAIVAFLVGCITAVQR